MSSLKNIILYSTPQGNVHVEVFFNNDTFWLTQKAMAQLFAVAVSAISKHLTNIYNTNELQKEATVSILETVALGRKPKASPEGGVLYKRWVQPIGNK